MKSMISHSSLRSRLTLSTALAGGLFGFGGSAFAQTPSTPTVAQGPGIVFTDGGDPVAVGDVDGSIDELGVNLGLNRNTIIEWGSFNVGNGESVNFSSALPLNIQAAVVNRVMGAQASNIDGDITSSDNVSVWLVNANGIMFGGNAVVQTGSFVATTLNVNDDDFPLLGGGSNYDLTAPLARSAAITVAPGAQFTMSTGNRGLVLVAPRIQANGGNFDGNGRDVAFVTATDVTLSYNGNGPLQVTIDAGTQLANGQVVQGTVNGRNVYFAMATQTGVVDALLNVGAAVNAQSASVSGTGIVLSAGSSVGPVTVETNANTAGMTALSTTGALVSTGQGGSLRAGSNGDITSTGNLSGLREVRFTGAGDVSVNNVTSQQGIVNITAGGVASVAGNVTAGSDYQVTGESVELGLDGNAETQRANASVQITATGGPIQGGDGLTLRSNHDELGSDIVYIDGTGGNISFAATSSIQGGLNRQSEVQIISDVAARSVTLGDVSARSLNGAVGADPVSDGLTRNGDITIGDVNLVESLQLTSNGGDIEIGSATVTGNNNDINLETSSTGAITATGALNAEDDVTVLGGGAVQLAGVTADDGLVSVESTGSTVTITGSVQAEDDVTVTASRLLTVAGNVTAGGNYRVTGRTVVLGDDADDELQQADGQVVIRSLLGAITGGAGLTLASGVDGGAGDFLILDSAAAIAAADVSLNAGDAAVGLRAAAGAAIRVGDITAEALGNPNAGNTAVGATFTHNGLVALGDVTLGSALDMTVAGALTTGDIDADGTVDLEAASITTADITGDAVTYAATAGTFSAEDITATEGDITGTSTLGTTIGSLDADDAISLSTSGAAASIVITGGVTAGTGITLDAQNALTLGNDPDDEALSAGSFVQLTAGGILTGGTGLSVESGSGAVTLTSDTIRFGGAAIRAGTTGDQNVVIAQTSAAALVTLGDVTAAALQSQIGADPVVNGIVRSTDVTVGDVVLDTTLRLQSTAGDVTVGSVDVNGAGQGINLQAFDTLTAPSSFNALGSITLVGGNALTLGNLTSVNGAVTAESTGGSLTVGTASGRTGVTLTSVGALTATGATSSNGATALTSTNGLVSAGNLSGTSVTVAASTSATVNGTVTASAGDYRVTGTSVNLGGDADGELQQATGAVDITASGGNITGGTGLTLRSDSNAAGGELLVLDTTGSISLAGASVQGGATGTTSVGVQAGAGQAITLGDITALTFGEIDAAHTAVTSGLVHDAALTVGDVDITGGSFVLATTLGAVTTGDVEASAITLQTLAGNVVAGDLTAESTGLFVSASGAVTGGDFNAQTQAQVGGNSLNLDSVTTGTGAVIASGGAGELRIGTVDSGATAFLSAIGGPIAINSATAADNLTVDSSGAIGGDTVARADLISTGGSVTVTAGGVATLGTASANQNLSITAVDIDALVLNATNGSLTLNATGASLNLGDLTGATGISVTAAGALTVTSATSSGGAVSLGSTNGSATIGDIDAAGDVTVTAAQTARVTGDVTAGGDYAVTGLAVSLGNDADGELQQAAGAITLTSNGGAILGGESLVLRANSDGAGAERLTFDLGATGNLAFADAAIEAGPAGQSDVQVNYTGTGPDIVFGDVTANVFRSFDGTSGFSNALALAGGSFTSGDLDFTSELIVFAAGPISTGSVVSESFVWLASDDALNINGPATATEFSVVAASITLADALTSTSSSIDLTATGEITGTDVTGATSVGISGGTVSFDSVTATAGSATLAANAGDLTVGDVTGAAVSLSSSGAGNDILVDTVTSAGAVTVDAADALGGATGERASLRSTAGAVTVTAGGTATLGVVAGATGVAVDADAIDATTLRSGGGDVVASAIAGDLDVGTVEAAGLADLSASANNDIGTLTAGSASISGTVASVDDATTTGAFALTATAGNASIGTGTVGDATLTASGNVIVSTGLTATGDIVIEAAGARLAPVTSTGGDIQLTLGAAGLTAVGGGRASLSATAGNITGVITGDALIDDLIAGGLIDLEAGGIDVTTADAGTTLDLVATSGDLIIGTATADGIMTLTAAEDLSFDTLTGGADVTLTATIGDITGGTVNAVGVLSTSSGGTTDIDDINASGIGITSAVIDLDAISTAGALALTSTVGNLTLGTGSAGTTVTLTSAANLTVTGSVTGGGDVSAQAVGAATIETIESTGGAVTVDAASIDATTANAATGLTLTATDGLLSLTTGEAGDLADLTGSGAVDIGTLTSGTAQIDAGTTIDATLLDIAGALVSTSTGATTIATVDVGSADVTGGTIDIEAATTDTTLALTTTGGTLELGTSTAGGAATLNAAGGLTVTTSLTSGGDATLTATGNATVEAVESTGGAVTITAAALDVGSATANGLLDLSATAGDVDLDTGSTGGAADIDATGALDIGTLTAGSAQIDAGTTLDATLLDIAGALVSTSAGASTVATIDAGSANVTGGTLTIGTATTDTTLLLTTTGGTLELGTGTAGGAATLNAAGDLTVTTSLTSGGDADLDATGAMTVEALSATGAAALNAGTTLSGGAISAGGPATTRSGGAMSLESLSGASIDALGGSVALGTASTGGSLRVEATAGNTEVNGTAGTTATLIATGDVIVSTGLTAGGAAEISAGGAARLAEVATTNGNVTITAGDVTGATADTRGSLTAGGAGSLLNVTASGSLFMDALTGPGGITVTADEIDVTTASAPGGEITLTVNEADNGTSGGLTMGSANAGGNILLTANGLATLGEVTAGGALLRIVASDVELQGIQTAATVELANRSTSGTMTLGAGSGGGFALSESELGRIAADQLTIDNGGGAVEIGTLAFTAGAGRNRVDLMTTGAIRVTGVVSGDGAGRVFRFGGAAGSDGALASEIGIETTTDAGGRLLFGEADVELRGARIVMGLNPGFLDTILGGGLGTGDVAGQFVSNPNSTLYNPSLGGGFYTDKNVLVANSLTVRFDDYALFQNTEVAGLNGGLVLGSGGNPASPALVIDARPGGNTGAFAAFGSLNGITGTAAALLGPDVIQLDGFDPANTRFNGCLVGSGAGCLTAVVVQPTLNVFDSSRVDVLRTADDLTLPFDPVVGTNNEALFSGLSAISDEVATEECPDGTESGQCETSEKDVTP